MASLAMLLALQVQVITTTGGHLPDRDFHVKLQTRDSVLEVIANPAPRRDRSRSWSSCRAGYESTGRL
ncbi:MAG: hypothetical protein Q8R92_10695 [Deltaproteobacteria bacterium]|nr:hypothetical protein [Deltaproteobacteria bacterium]